MLRMVRTIEWELCETEEAALLRENELLRQLRPPFNVVNVAPESYYLIGLARRGRRIGFRLTMNEQAMTEPGELLYGAYKGRGSVRDGYSALIRLVWACHHELEQLGYPAHLTRYRPLERFEVELGEALGEAELKAWESSIRRFLNGTSRTLLFRLTETLLTNEAIPPFAYRVIQEDLETLESFYAMCPGRNRALKRHHKLFGLRQIPQMKLDDLIVVFQLRKRG
jgi:excinuclease UvrABC nuclease subunit